MASAQAMVTSFLDQWGLGGLAQWAWDRYRQLGGGSNAMAQIQLELPEQKTFEARFPAYKRLAESGHAMSVGDMLNYEQQAIETMRAAGIPQGFYDQPKDIGTFLENHVSLNELQTRVSMAQQAALAPSETKQSLQEMYGLDAGHLTALFLDPTVAEPLLQQKFAAGQLGGAALQTGFGSLSADEAQSLVSQGVSPGAAQQGFAQLAKERPLFSATAQEQTSIDQQTQLEAQFGQNAGAVTRLQRRQQRRVADFSGTSGFGATQGGVSGLGGQQPA